MDLVGTKYEPPFDLFAAKPRGTTWRVISADFVTLDLRHRHRPHAPAFGEDDFQAHWQALRRRSTISCAVKPTARSSEMSKGRVAVTRAAG